MFWFEKTLLLIGGTVIAKMHLDDRLRRLHREMEQKMEACERRQDLEETKFESLERRLEWRLDLEKTKAEHETQLRDKLETVMTRNQQNMAESIRKIQQQQDDDFKKQRAQRLDEILHKECKAFVNRLAEGYHDCQKLKVSCIEKGEKCPEKVFGECFLGKIKEMQDDLNGK